MVSAPTRTSEILFSVEQLLELTVRNGLDLGEAQPQGLDQHHAEEGRKDVPGGELVLALLGLLGRLLRFWLRRLVAVVAEAEKLQEAPTGRRFHVLGRLVEHVGLPCGALADAPRSPTVENNQNSKCRQVTTREDYRLRGPRRSIRSLYCFLDPLSELSLNMTRAPGSTEKWT